MPILDALDKRTRKAVAYYWKKRHEQKSKKVTSGSQDQGDRGAVTGGAQMNGFADLLCDLIGEAGIKQKCIHRNTGVELPGYFRPSKKWDIVVVDNAELVAAIELKSQVGPSFGNNVNNRAEEAIASAVDLWKAYDMGAFKRSARPWVGYLFLLEECDKSMSPVRLKEPHFPAFVEFRLSSYAKRYELLCRRIVEEKHYSSASFILSRADLGMRGDYTEPIEELTFMQFARKLVGHVAAYTGKIDSL